MGEVPGKTASRWAVAVLIVAAVAAAVIALIRLDATGEKGSGLSDDFAYDLTRLAQVDPNLVLYEQAGLPMATGLARSRAIALAPDGRLYIAGDRAICVLTGAGVFDTRIELSGEPQCLTIADDGTIYVGMRDHVEVFDPQGRQVASWEPLGDETVLTSIAKHRDSIFVADAGHRIVLHYDTTGVLIDHIGEKDLDRNIPGFAVPSPHFDLAVSRDGLLRVVNPGRRRVEAYTLDGDLEFWWGDSSTSIESFCGCCNPVSLALLPNGAFVTAEKGLERVKVYNSDGAFVGVVAGAAQLGKSMQVKICDTPEQCQGDALDLAAGPDGRVYVLDPERNVIRVFREKEASQ